MKNETTGIKIADAANILGVTKYKVNQLITYGVIELIANSKPKMVTLDSVNNAKEIVDAMQAKQPLRFINNCFQNPMIILDFRSGYYRSSKYRDPAMQLINGRYGATKDGNIINIFTGHTLKSQTVDHDYLEVSFPGIDGNRLFMLLHRVIAFAWCPNARFATEVHHKDDNRQNNSADNLIWLFREEHKYAHQLLDEAKATGDWSDYNAYIDTMSQANMWTPEQLKKGIRWVPGEFNDKDYLHLFYVTEDTYNRIHNEHKSIEDIKDPAPEIWFEYWSPRKQGE